MKKNCENCGREFEPKTPVHKNCSAGQNYQCYIERMRRISKKSDYAARDRKKSMAASDR